MGRMCYKRPKGILWTLKGKKRRGGERRSLHVNGILLCETCPFVKGLRQKKKKKQGVGVVIQRRKRTGTRKGH